MAITVALMPEQVLVESKSTLDASRKKNALDLIARGGAVLDGKFLQQRQALYGYRTRDHITSSVKS